MQAYSFTLLFYYLAVKIIQMFYTFLLNQRNGSKKHKYNNCIVLYKKSQTQICCRKVSILFVGGAYVAIGALFTIVCLLHTCLL